MDGSSKGKPRPACIGGILRDDQGMILARFAASVGIRDSNEAEFMAIVFTFEMSRQQERIKNMEIILESDSKNGIAWVNRKEECPWNSPFLCNKLQNILLVLKNVSFVHRNR